MKPAPLAVSVLVLVALFASLWGDAALNIREVLTATSFGPQGRLVEAVRFPDGEHTRNLVITFAPDGRWWIMHAERMAREGLWRIRSTGSDNAPDGREVHWSSLPAWNLVVLGKLLAPWNPRPDLSAIEWAALFVGPVTLFLFLLLGLFVSIRAFGRVTALAFPLAVLAARSLQGFFRAGESDHHGLVSMFAMFGVLFLLCGRLGLRSGGGRGPSRAWFVWAGVMSAAGLWVSAATALPVIAATGVGVLFSAWWLPRKIRPDLDPSVWRLWGVSAGLASFGFYLLEYFPHHMGWRLEVNHPVYALAWAAGGEVLCRLVRWVRDGVAPVRDFRTAAGATGLLLAAALPAFLVVFGGERFFVISDRFLYALHDFFINEFQSVLDLSRQSGVRYAVFGFSLAWAAVVIAGLALVRSKVSAVNSALIVFAALPAAVMTALAFHQIRWSGVAAALTIPLVMVSLFALHDPAARAALWRRVTAWGVLAAAAALAPLALWLRYAEQIGLENTVEKSQAPSALTRDVCHRIAAAAGGRRPVILASPSCSTEMIYYGGAKGIGTLYWENLPGLQTGARIYSVKDEEAAFSLIKQHGITHLVFFSWDSFGQRYARLDRGLGREDEARDGFVAGLLEGTRPQPVWLNPLWYPVPPEYELGDDHWVRIYEVVPGQTRAQWLYHVGVYQLDAGKTDLAGQSFRESLVLDGDQTASRLGLLMLAAAGGADPEVSEHAAALLRTDPDQGPRILENAAVQLEGAGLTGQAALVRAALGLPARE